MEIVCTKILVAVLFGLIRLFFGVLPLKLQKLWGRWEKEEDQHHFVNERRHQQVKCALAMCQSFGGGVLFATAFLHMMPEVYRSVEELKKFGNLESDYPLSQLTISIGFFFVYFLEEFSHWFVDTVPLKPCSLGQKNFKSEIFQNNSRQSTPMLINNRISPVKMAFVVEDSIIKGDNMDQNQKVQEMWARENLDERAAKKQLEANSVKNVFVIGDFTKTDQDQKAQDILVSQENCRNLDDVAFVGKQLEANALNAVFVMKDSTNNTDQVDQKSQEIFDLDNDRNLSDRALDKQLEANAQNSEETSQNPDSDDSEISDLSTQQHDIRFVLMVLALSLHAIFEGLSIGLEKSQANIWYLFTAVSIHSATILFYIGLEMLLSKSTMKRILYHVCILSVTSPMGVIMGLVITITSDMNTRAKSVAVVLLEGLSAGAILYITFFEILSKEKQKRAYRLRRGVCILSGFGLMACLQCLEIHID